MTIQSAKKTFGIRRSLALVLAASILALATGGARFAAARAGEDGATLTVRMTGFANSQKGVGVALYNDRKGYDKEKAFREARAEIKDGAATVEFRNLAPGEYAVACHHDENGNGKVDYSLLRRSIEGIGVSNNIRLTMTHEPTWDETKFQVAPGARKTIDLKVHYSF